MEKMDEAFFAKILRQSLKDETIKNVKIEARNNLSARGNNFLSEMVRFSLRFSRNEKNEKKMITEDISLITKIEPIVVSPGADMIKSQKVFSTESKIFQAVLPEIEKLVNRRLSPKLFYASNNSPGLIVLEDLTPLGFKTKDRQMGLSMEHVLMVIEKIAQFHAASVYQCERNPELIKSFTKGIMTEETPKNMLRVVEQQLMNVAKEVAQWQGNRCATIAEKLKVTAKKFAQEILNVTKYDEDEFCVLNHGDCWINNIMFRENEQGKPIDAVLVDYQMCVYSSPVIDLIYFLSVCPEMKLHATKNEFFIKEYLRFLSALMERYNCKTRPPTFEDLEKAMLKRRMWAIMSDVAFHPRMLADVTEVETFDEILSTGITNMDVFKNPTVTTILQRVLPMMDDKGYFD